MSLNIGQYLIKLRRTKKCAIFWRTTLYIETKIWRGLIPGYCAPDRLTGVCVCVCVCHSERLDATLDNYEAETRKASTERCRTTSNEVVTVPASTGCVSVPRSLTADALVNGGGGRSNGRFVTQVDLHRAPGTVPLDVVTQPTTTPASSSSLPLPEPEPDYDGKDHEETAVDSVQAPPPPTQAVSCHQPPTPPPLPPPSSIGFAAGLEIARGAAGARAEPGEVAAAARRKDEAHVALMEAVERRRHLLDSVDVNLIADSIENRVQRSKMLQTVYRADNSNSSSSSSVALHRSPAADTTAERPPVGLLAASPSTSGGDFTSEAERVRLEYVRRLQTQTKQPAPPRPPSKPLRSLNGSGDGTGRPATTVKSVMVNESHNRALASYMNGSAKVYTAAAAARGEPCVRLYDVGESTTELRVLTDDTASVLSSLSTLSTASSVGVGGVGTGDGGATSPHGSPSQSSSGGDSGFVKSSSTAGGVELGTVALVEHVVIPPPSEFASSSSPVDNSSSSSSSVSVQTAVAGTTLRSVARNQSHSIVFPARTQLAHK